MYAFLSDGRSPANEKRACWPNWKGAGLRHVPGGNLKVQKLSRDCRFEPCVGQFFGGFIFAFRFLISSVRGFLSVLFSSSLFPFSLIRHPFQDVIDTAMGFRQSALLPPVLSSHIKIQLPTTHPSRVATVICRTDSPADLFNISSFVIFPRNPNVSTLVQ